MNRFEVGSHFNANANFKEVKIGAGCHVLETELNEMQEIAYHRQQKFIKDYVGEGIMNIGNLSYADGFLTITDEVAVVGGHLIEITQLTKEVLRGQHAYLKVWEKEITYNDTIKFKGNAQETRNIENEIFDLRVNEETSRRIQIMYDLVTEDTDNNALYLDLGYVDENGFKVTVTTKGFNLNKFNYHCTAMESQTVIDFPRPYAFGKSTMLVFVDGNLLMPGDFEEISPTCIRFNIELHEGQEIYCYAENYVKPVTGVGHAETHYWDGNDPIDIGDLADKEDLLDKIRGLTGDIIVDGGGFGDLDTERDTVYSGGTFTDPSDILDPSIGENSSNTREVEFQVVNEIFQWRYVGESLWRDLIDFNTISVNLRGLTVSNEKIYIIDETNTPIGEGVKYKSVIDNLTSTDTEAPLSANQGKELKRMIDNSTGGSDIDVEAIKTEIKAYVDTELLGGSY